MCIRRQHHPARPGEVDGAGIGRDVPVQVRRVGGTHGEGLSRRGVGHAPGQIDVRGVGGQRKTGAEIQITGAGQVQIADGGDVAAEGGRAAANRADCQGLQRRGVANHAETHVGRRPNPSVDVQVERAVQGRGHHRNPVVVGRDGDIVPKHDVEIILPVGDGDVAVSKQVAPKGQRRVGVGRRVRLHRHVPATRRHVRESDTLTRQLHPALGRNDLAAVVHDQVAPVRAVRVRCPRVGLVEAPARRQLGAVVVGEDADAATRGQKPAVDLEVASRPTRDVAAGRHVAR